MRVVVIVPVYNVEAYLNRCVDSILAQTVGDFDIVLIDDGSPDRCGMICDEYAQRDARIHVIHQMNAGLSAARNAGLDYAFKTRAFEWVTFIDSDDWVHPQYLELLMKGVLEGGTSISACYFQHTWGDVAEISEFRFNVVSPEDFWCENHLAATVACCKLFPLEWFRELRFPLGKWHEDEYVTYKLLFRDEKVAVITAPLYYYLLRGDSICANKFDLRTLHKSPAYREQLDLFKERGYNKAYEFVVTRYLNFLAEFILHLAGSKEEILVHSLREELDAGLKRYGRDVSFPFGNNKHLIKLLHPIAYYCIWPIARVFWVLRKEGVQSLLRMTMGKARSIGRSIHLT